MNDFNDKAYGYLKMGLLNKKTILTTFLSLTEQEIISNILKNKVTYKFYGGYSNSETKRCLINYEIDDTFKIVCLKIKSNNKSLKLSHSNILGSFMSLGLNKDTIGDIIVSERVFFIKEEVLSYVIQNFTSIANNKITLEVVDGTDLKRNISLSEKKYFVNSLRLDLIVSKLANITRYDAQLMIKSSLIKVNYKTVLNQVTRLKVNDIISIRKTGRFILLDDSTTSKKGNIVLKVGKYI